MESGGGHLFPGSADRKCCEDSSLPHPRKCDPLVTTPEATSSTQPATAVPTTPNKRKASTTATATQPAIKKAKVNNKEEAATITKDVEEDEDDAESIDVKEEAVSEED